MATLALQMIFLCSLLISSSSSSSSSRCLSAGQLRSRLWRRHWTGPGVSGVLRPPGAEERGRSCETAAREMRGGASARSLAPWIYRLDRDRDRFPPDISFAECLCQGCIINRREDTRFNSVPVTVQVMVLSRRTCPDDPSKYLVKREMISVPVACICAVPKTN